MHMDAAPKPSVLWHDWGRQWDLLKGLKDPSACKMAQGQGTRIH